MFNSTQHFARSNIHLFKDICIVYIRFYLSFIWPIPSISNAPAVPPVAWPFISKVEITDSIMMVPVLGLPGQSGATWSLHCVRGMCGGVLHLLASKGQSWFTPGHHGWDPLWHGSNVKSCLFWNQLLYKIKSCISLSLLYAGLSKIGQLDKALWTWFNLCIEPGSICEIEPALQCGSAPSSVFQY